MDEGEEDGVVEAHSAQNLTKKKKKGRKMAKKKTKKRKERDRGREDARACSS